MRLLISAVFLIVGSIGFSQSQFCGTSYETQHLAMASIRSIPNQHQKDQGTIYIPLKVHSLTNDNSSSFYSAWPLFETLCTLNEDFAPSGIQFILEEDINYIKNTSWNNHEEYKKGEEMMNKNNVDGMVNCYLVSNPAGNCGYFTYQGDGVALNKSCLGISSHTWAHELGHFFTLPHTFIGWEGIRYSSSKKTSDYQSDVSRRIENVERTECNRQADNFCDTEPDYISYRWTCGENGFSTTKLKDTRDSLFTVDGSLFMSYSNDQCMNRFSTEQMSAMHKSINGPRSELLRPDVVPKFIPAIPVVLNSPLDSSLTGASDILFSWDEIPNAKYYVLQISRTPNFSIIIKNLLLETNHTIIDSILAGKDYWWRVRAYSEFDFCGTESEVLNFKTESVISSVSDHINDKKIRVYPNPLSAGKKLTIGIDSKVDHIHNIQFTTAQGHEFNVADYENYSKSLLINTENLVPGLYVVTLSTNLGLFSEKVLIHN